MYDHKKIEKKWQKKWEVLKTFKTTNSSNQKFYVLDMFPYPSGSGLHVGHPKGYTATDIVARYKRLKGFDVLHPIGWDAFGLPAEQYALKTGNHPAKFTLENINNFKRQLKQLGFSFDYEKEINTTDPEFYKQTQWIFQQFYKQGLAEIKNVNVNWCESLGTVLANEEILENEKGEQVSERGNFLVIQKPMKQWVLKITKYAKELYSDLENLDWPESLKNLQRNWINNPDNTLHLRDWVFSRQRYWGEPFPIFFDKDNKIHLVKKLPLKLPKIAKIEISKNGQSPLFNDKEWVFFEEDGNSFRHDTNTMPQWAGSSWYYLAYILKNSDGSYVKLNSSEAKKRFEKWLPVDLYVGGQEHAVLHLLYARFWHKLLYKIGIVPTKEPFQKIINQGMILGPDNQKMSKSKGNIINPDLIIEEYGADTLRLYEMFMGPIEDSKSWSTIGVIGMRKWLDRINNILNIVTIDNNYDPNYYHTFVKEVTFDIENLKFNTAISKMMVFMNESSKNNKISLIALKSFLIILSLFAPHFAEEQLEKYGFLMIYKQKWPEFNAQKTLISILTIPIQVNGKLRGTIDINVSNDIKDLINDVKEIPNVKKFLKDKTIIKEIIIPKKLINFVVK